MGVLDGLVDDVEAKRNSTNKKDTKLDKSVDQKSKHNEVNQQEVETNIEHKPVSQKAENKKKKSEKTKLDPELTTQARLSHNCNEVLLLIKKHEKLGSINDVILHFLKKYKSGNKPLDTYIDFILSRET